jgi:hypothetical protein
VYHKPHQGIEICIGQGFSCQVVHKGGASVATTMLDGLMHFSLTDADCDGIKLFITLSFSSQNGTEHR